MAIDFYKDVINNQTTTEKITRDFAGKSNGIISGYGRLTGGS